MTRFKTHIKSHVQAGGETIALMDIDTLELDEKTITSLNFISTYVYPRMQRVDFTLGAEPSAQCLSIATWRINRVYYEDKSYVMMVRPDNDNAKSLMLEKTVKAVQAITEEEKFFDWIYGAK